MNFRLIGAISMAMATLAGCGSSDGDAPAAKSLAAAPTTVQVQSGGGRSVQDGPQTSVIAGNYADFSLARVDDQLTLTHKQSGAVTVVPASVQRVVFDDLTVEPRADARAAVIFRLYQAAFNRAPLPKGLGFWTAAYSGANVSIDHIAGQFVDSPEFQGKYGALSNAEFVTQLFQNILHRAPRPEGFKFWLTPLEAGVITRAHLLAQISESDENKAGTAAATANGVAYEPWITGGTGQAVGADHTVALAYWNASAPTGLALLDPYGVPVPGGKLSCTAAHPAVLTISADCRFASAKRLGLHAITVSGA
ncbi:MAG: DUF4214 domain-containing protein, partial [Gammaproteobacteria bacterium]